MATGLFFKVLRSTAAFFVILFVINRLHARSPAALSSIAAAAFFLGSARVIVRALASKDVPPVSRDELIRLAVAATAIWLIVGVSDLSGAQRSPWTLIAGLTGLVTYCVASGINPFRKPRSSTGCDSAAAPGS